MIGIILILICAAAVFFYFFATAARPTPSWLKDYSYAHRGLHNAEFPENSMPAFENAITHGYAIELDVHLSKDGVLMVFHDDELTRMTGEQGSIGDHTAQELQSMKLAGSNYGIPTLDEVLELVMGRTPLLIELKNIGRAGKLEIALYDRVKRYDGRFALQSFSPFSMRWYLKNAPDILRGQLSGDFRSGAGEISRWKIWVVCHLMTNMMCRPNFINYEQNGVENRVIRRLRKNGTPIFAWTIRTDVEARDARPFVDALVFEGIEPRKDAENAG